VGFHLNLARSLSTFAEPHRLKSVLLVTHTGHRAFHPWNISPQRRV